MDLLLVKLRQRLNDNSLSLELTDSAKEYIIEGGYDVSFGARPLKRFIQSHVETLLAREILSRNLNAGDTLIVDRNENGLYVK